MFLQTLKPSKGLDLAANSCTIWSRGTPKAEVLDFQPGLALFCLGNELLPGNIYVRKLSFPLG